MKLKTLVIFLGILVLSGTLRFWQLDNIPPGLNIDEVSEGYNAYSLVKTGKDRYGQLLPIIFKSFGSYQPPVYTYLTVVPTYLIGPSILTVKLVSAISGIFLVFLSFLITYEFLGKKTNLALLIALVVGIVPWAIFFSRVATEASPALTIFVIGFYFSLKSVKNLKLFPLASFFLGLATHAYYSERVVSLLFLIIFLGFYRKEFLKNKKWLFWGLLVFGLTQVPHFLILKSGAFSRRLEQVSYLDRASFENYAGVLNSLPFGRAVFVIREFTSQYLAYFSPRNLFFEPDDQLARSIPDLSVFYQWMFVPYVFGFYYLIKNKKNLFVRNLILLMIIAPVPAALSTDPFYTLRVLILLWILSLVIALGVWQILQKVKFKAVGFGVLTILSIFSLFTFYTHYFVLYKFERAGTVGFSDLELIEVTQARSEKKFVVDLSRDLATGLRFAFFREYNPVSFQEEIGQEFLGKYYSSVDYEKEYKIENVEIRPIDWQEDIYREQIIVGDNLAISQDQVDEHKLELEFEIKDLTGIVVLKGYATNPLKKCLSSRKKSVYCDKWL